MAAHSHRHGRTLQRLAGSQAAPASLAGGRAPRHTPLQPRCSGRAAYPAGRGVVGHVEDRAELGLAVALEEGDVGRAAVQHLQHLSVEHLCALAPHGQYGAAALAVNAY